MNTKTAANKNVPTANFFEIDFNRVDLGEFYTKFVSNSFTLSLAVRLQSLSRLLQGKKKLSKQKL